MARSLKQGLDYFPLDVDLDDKFSLIEAEFGIEGFGIIIRLFQKIYKEGYFYSWTKKEQLLFSKSVNVDINRINVIINAAVEWKLFSENLFNEYRILTSHGIQKRYLTASNRREKVKIHDEYLLIDISEYKNAIIVNINPENDDAGTQSKVKEIKEENNTHAENSESQNQTETPKPDQPDPDPKSPPDPPPVAEKFYLTAEKKKLKGQNLEWFEEFWRIFDHPRGKAAAADVWLKIDNLHDPGLRRKIMYGAKKSAEERAAWVAKGGTPLWAERFLKKRRWEDYTEPLQKVVKHESKKYPTHCARCGKEALIMDAKDGLCRECFTGKKPVEMKATMEKLIQKTIGGVL